MSYYSLKSTYLGGDCGGALLSVETTPYLGTCVRVSDASSTSVNAVNSNPYQIATVTPNPDLNAGGSYLLTIKKYSNSACSGTPVTPTGSVIQTKCTTITDPVSQITTSAVVSFSTTFPTPMLNFDGYRISFWGTSSCSTTPSAMYAAPLQVCNFGGVNIAKYSMVTACSDQTYQPRLYSDPKCQTAVSILASADSTKLPVCLVQKNLTTDAAVNYPFGMYSGDRAYASVSCLKATVIVKPINFVAVIVSVVGSVVVAGAGIVYYLYFYNRRQKADATSPSRIHPPPLNTDEHDFRPSEHTPSSPSKSVHPEPSSSSSSSTTRGGALVELQPRSLQDAPSPKAANANTFFAPPAPKQKVKQGW